MTGANDLLNLVRFRGEAGKPKQFKKFLLALLMLWIGGMSFALPQRLAAQEPTPSTKWQRFERTEVHMGSPFKIVFYSDDEKLANRAFEQAFGRIAQLDKVLSDYDLESETSRICASAPHLDFQPISSDLFAVLTISSQVGKKTEGAFDITVGPLTKLWRRTRRQKELPTKEVLTEALGETGVDGISLCTDKAAVRLTKKGMRLDFGGVGQGFAADEVLKILSEMGIRRALVNASGDVVAAEPPPGEKGWKVAIAGLEPKTKSPSKFVWLSRGSISTSGDAFQSVEIDGKRYSHIVDPKTGLGMQRRISATTFAQSGALADTLATALCVLPTKQGLEILAREFPGAEALILEMDGQERIETASRNFPHLEPMVAGLIIE